MPSKPKTARCEHSPEIIAVILSLHNPGKSHGQIGDHLKIAKSSVTTIIYRQLRNPDELLCPTKCARRPSKLDAQTQ